MANPNPTRVSAIALCTLVLASCNQNQPVAQTSEAAPPTPDPAMEGKTIQPQEVPSPTASMSRPETLPTPQASARPDAIAQSRTAAALQTRRFRQPRITSGGSPTLMTGRSPRLPIITASPTRLPPLTARRTATLPISRLLARTPQIPQSIPPQPLRTTPQAAPSPTTPQPQANLFLNPQATAQGNQTPPTGETLTPPQGMPATPIQPIQPIQPIPTQLAPIPSESLASADGSLTQSPTIQNGEPLPSLSPPERMALTPTSPTTGREVPPSTGASPTDLRSTPVTPVPTSPNSLRPPQETPTINQWPQTAPPGPKEETPTSRTEEPQPGTTAARSNSNSVPITNPAYVLGAGDRLYIAIAGAPQLSGARQVQEDGTLALPGVGNLRVNGMTLAKATTEVAERYSAQVRVPRVAIAVVQPRPLRVSISGEVNRPGFYRLPVGQNQQAPNLMQALQMARGVTQTADLQKVQVQRPQRSGTPQVITLNLRQIMQSDQKQDLSLQDGDIILVPNALTETASQTN